jgi:hypothetical protein
MLIRKWTAILSVALQAKLISVRRPQIVSCDSAMGIMAIGTTHLSFA